MSHISVLYQSYVSPISVIYIFVTGVHRWGGGLAYSSSWILLLIKGSFARLFVWDFGQIFRSSISKVLDIFVKGLAAVYQRKCSFSSRKALSDRPLLGEAWKYQNGWIFRKVPNRFWPPPLIFGKSYRRFVGTHRRLHVLVLLSNIFSM